MAENELLKRIVSEEELKRVGYIQEIIERFDSDPQLRGHYRSRFLATDLQRDGYTPDEIELAELRIKNKRRWEDIGEAISRGDLPQWILQEIV